MKNILQERPDAGLTGRLAEAVALLKPSDIKDKKILDVGCGYGWCELEMLKLGASAIVGTDLSEADLATARQYVKDSKVSFSPASAIDLPFPDNSFDTVVSWDVIEHIPKTTEPKMFSEINRVLKKDGAFYLATPYASFWSRVLDPAWWLTGHRHYSKQTLTRFAQQGGFTVEELRTKGGMWTLLFTLNFYISKWILRRKPLAADFYARQEKREYRQPTGIASIFAVYRKS